MKLPNFSNLYLVGKSLILANRPEMLLGAALVATVGSVVLAAHGGYKSGYLVAETDAERLAEDKPPLTTTEVALLTWKNYVLPAGVTVTAVMSTCGLHVIHVKEKKQLVAAGLAAVEEAKKEAKIYIDDLKASVEENTTAKTKKKIDDATMERIAARNDGLVEVWNSDGVIEQFYLCQDILTNGAKWTNQLRVNEAVNLVNADLAVLKNVSLNTFYDHVGLPEIQGDLRGWNAGDVIEAKWSTSRRDDGQPVCVYKLDPPPTEDYDKSR